MTINQEQTTENIEIRIISEATDNVYSTQNIKEPDSIIAGVVENGKEMAFGARELYEIIKG